MLPNQDETVQEDRSKPELLDEATKIGSNETI